MTGALIGYAVGAPSEDGEEQVGAVDSAVIGGTPANTADWPGFVGVGDADAVSCTDTLIGSKSMLTAGHCTSAALGPMPTADPTTGHFGSDDLQDASTKKIDVVKVEARGDKDVMDVAILTLAETAPMAPYPLATRCGAVTVGGDVTLVGYGQIDDGSAGVRRSKTLKVDKLDCTNQHMSTLGCPEAGKGLAIVTTPTGMCGRDSGGPPFVVNKYGRDNSRPRPLFFRRCRSTRWNRFGSPGPAYEDPIGEEAPWRSRVAGARALRRGGQATLPARRCAETSRMCCAIPSAMRTRFSLRPYQQEAIQRVIAARRAGVRRQLVCLPTGAGKTVIFSELARMARRPVLVLAHRRELVQQACDKIARALHRPSESQPSAGQPATSNSTKLVAIEQGQVHAPADAHVVVASIRSLREERLSRLLSARRFGLVVYDECHHAPAEDNQRVLRTLGAFDPDWDGTLLGFTATTVRGDGAGLDSVFEQIVYQRTISEMVADGYLVPLRGYRIATAADLQAVNAGAGDFVVDELAEAVDIDERNALVARSIQELARDRRTIAFCVTVHHARHLARALNAIGVACGMVYGDMKADKRQQTLDDFRAGRLSAVTNVGVLTEGFDDPEVSCIAMARPTRSAGFYTQCVGRGTRLAPGKTDCLVLDFVDLSELSLMTLPTLAGLPYDLDLEGVTLDEAERTMKRLWDDHPGFEIEPGSITLAEIQRRAAAFDPLSLKPDDEVRAVSANAWESLGSRGLALHVYWGKQAARKDRLSEILVLDSLGQPGVNKRGRRWRVTLDGKAMERFSRIEDAVEAVDYEVGRKGRDIAVSARPSASWRRQPVPAALAEQLAALQPPQCATSRGDAVRLLAYAKHGPRARRKKR